MPSSFEAILPSLSQTLPYRLARKPPASFPGGSLKPLPASIFLTSPRGSEQVSCWPPPVTVSTSDPKHSSLIQELADDGLTTCEYVCLLASRFLLSCCTWEGKYPTQSRAPIGASCAALLSFLMMMQCILGVHRDASCSFAHKADWPVDPA